MNLKTGDSVVVIAGKDKGKVGKIKAVYRTENKVMVEGVAEYKKYDKRTGKQITHNRKIDRSNVAYEVKGKPEKLAMKIDPKTKKKTRVVRSTGQEAK